ncbi:MAG: branched-chain amino acid ABC transporter substrate-binding protein [Candidatus Eremiobacteraeota bacterium]|nr:branched-chain amino acid ABC transporter substrate-binding protein [Candidatus Eremiobacteraeota bacterium]
MLRTGGFARLAVLTAVAFSTACSSSSPTSSSSQSTSDSSAPASLTVKIGIDLPLSGADAANGIPTRDGAVQAIEDANAKGTHGITFVAYDLDDAVQGAHDPAQGAQNVKSFVADDAVLGMVGPFNSSVAQAQIPLTNDAGLTQISPATTNPGLTKGPDAAKLRTSHPDVNAFFRVCTTDDRQGAAGAQFARKLGLRKAFVVDDNETYGKGLADVFAAQFQVAGGTVLGHEHLTKGQADYKALLTKARALGPDLIFYGGTTVTGGGLLRKQMGDAGLGAVAFLGGDGVSDRDFITTSGDAANGAYYTVAAPETSKLKSAASFVRAYEKRWHTDVGPYSANAYAAASIEISAVEKALAANGGKLPTRDAVRAIVAATKNFASPIGSIGFDSNGDTTAPILSVYKIANGKPSFVEQITLKV